MIHYVQKRRESEQKEKPKNHKTIQHSNIHLEYKHLPKMHQMVRLGDVMET